MGLSVMQARHQEVSSRLRKSTLKSSLGSRRRTHALLSIKPVYADAIFGGRKRFEFRRAIFRREVRVVVVYATSPVSRVLGEFDVNEVISDEVGALWKRTQSKAGIDCAGFFRYFAGRDVGHAISIGNVRRYPRALELC